MILQKLRNSLGNVPKINNVRKAFLNELSKTEIAQIDKE